MTERRGFLKTLFGGAAVYPAVKTIETMKLEQNDTLVLTVDQPISQETAARLHDILQAKFPDHKCIVLDHGLALKVLKG